MEDDDNNKWLCGLKYATELGFTYAEFKEAIKRIKTPDVANANQLLVALIDVSIRDDTTTSTNLTANENIVTNTNSNNNINVNASTCCAPSDQGATDVVKTGFATTSTAQTQANIVDIMMTSSPAQSQSGKSSLSTPTSSSCYSSITSFPTSSSAASSSDQSLESLQQATLTLRKVYIDGSNVARAHGKDVIFSWLGIKLCVDWFVRRHHAVKVFVPRDRCQQADESISRYLNDLDALVQTPSGCNDDLFIIEAARHNNGVIVSNDLFRDEKRFNNEMQHFIYLHSLSYVFVDDLFIPTADPLGRTGPTLNEFLKDLPEQQAQRNYHHGKVSRTKSHQKYQSTKTNYSMKQQPNSVYHQSKLLTRSLPMEQSSTMANDINPHISVAPSGQHHSYFQNHYHQQQQLKIQQQVHRKPHNHGHQRQHVGRAISVACANPSGITKDGETQVVGGRSALCRTKSHNI